MSVLVRPPVEVANQVRESAKKQGIPINTWWVRAAQAELDRERIDIAGIAAAINADPVMREVMDRLGQ